MIAAVSDVIALDGFWLLVIAAVLAGLVRGFTGFGTAMVYLPFAGQVLEPVAALITLIVIDLFGPLPAVPRALREGHVGDVARLGLGALAGTPVGVAILLVLSPEVFRTSVAAISLGLLIALLSGIRYRGVVRRRMLYAIGAASGLLNGAVGLPGPPVILLYMARPLPVQVIRASILLFLVLTDILMASVFAWRGLLDFGPVMVGFAVLVPYLLAVMAGSRIFDPKHERIYRRVAYAIIAGSAAGGLPIWD